MERVRETKSKAVGIDRDIPSAPTLEDFYFDPGIAGQDSQAFQDPLGFNPFSVDQNHNKLLVAVLEKTC